MKKQLKNSKKLQKLMRLYQMINNESYMIHTVMQELILIQVFNRVVIRLVVFREEALVDSILVMDHSISIPAEVQADKLIQKNCLMLSLVVEEEDNEVQDVEVTYRCTLTYHSKTQYLERKKI